MTNRAACLALLTFLVPTARAAETIKTSRGVLSWDDKQVYRDGKPLGTFQSAPGDAEAIANLTRLFQNSGTEKGFTVCFDPPQLKAPDDAVLDRVKSYAPLIRELLAASKWDGDAWVKAITTHESGADARAVSPTGCAGLAAICQGKKDGPHCCVKDARDGYRTIYDLCNSEAAGGYRCDPATDERFDPRFALRHEIEQLRGIDARLKRLKGKGVRLVPELAVPMAYNAGWGVFPAFPERASTVEDIMSQFDLGRGPYRAWDDGSKANKAVELYDYLRWFPFLAVFYRTGAATAPAPAPALLCYHDGPGAHVRFQSYPDGSLGEILIRAAFEPITVKRLSFGKYRDAPALFVPGAWEN